MGAQHVGDFSPRSFDLDPGILALNLSLYLSLIQLGFGLKSKMRKDGGGVRYGRTQYRK